MDGYYNTPNSMVPLNNREPGTIADVAVRQLQRYRETAQTWPVYQEMRHGVTMGPRWVHACRLCEQAIWFNADTNKVPYDYTEAEKLTLIVAHIRQNHTDDTGEIHGPDGPGNDQILDSASGNDIGSVDPGNAYRYEH